MTCRDGSRYAAKRLVSTLPFSTLRQVGMQPPLRDEQARAVKTLLYQPISVMFVRALQPFWNEDRRPASMWTNGIVGSVAAQRFGRTDDEITGLMVQARGELSHLWDRLGQERAKRLVVEEIERLRPAAKGKLKATFLQSWSMDRFSGGDWSVFSPGQASMVEAMAKPAGRMHFAGEHTAPTNRGLEAALESSERVALEVLELL